MSRIWIPAICLLVLCLSVRGEDSIQPRITTTGAQPSATGPASHPSGSFFLREFRFEGNTVISAEELHSVTRRFEGKHVTPEDLEIARQAVTQKYIEKGYINSGAVLPEQDISKEIVLIQVVEGRLGEIKINAVNSKGEEVSSWLAPGYLTSRIKAGAGNVLNLINLKERLQLLRENPNIERINAELKPGLRPGESSLEVKYEEANPWHLGFEFSNKRPPSVGSTSLEVYASHQDLTGNSDALNLRYTILSGPLDELELSGADDYGVAYTLPISPSDTTLTFSFDRSSTVVIEQPFEELDIDSETNSFAITLRQPVYHTLSNEVALFVTGTVRENHSELMGTPFSFSDGAVDGESRIAAVRFGAEWFRRDINSAFSARSTFSVGIDAFGATEHSGDIPDSAYLTWLGQLQYARRLGNSDIQLIARSNVQLSNDRLLVLEQFALGGFDTVRGYRENQLVRDNGVSATLEFRIPIIRKSGESVLDLAPFVDYGYGWNSSSPFSQNLSSVGVGLVSHPIKSVSIQFYYGYALRDTDSTDDLQDIGIHFQFNWTPI